MAISVTMPDNRDDESRRMNQRESARGAQHGDGSTPSVNGWASSAAATEPGMGAVREEEDDARRLWRPLSHRPRPPKQLEDLDRYGETAIGIVQRLRRPLRRLRRAAQDVVQVDESMNTLAEEAFDREIETARENARRGARTHQARAHAFAVVRQAIRRTLGMVLFPVQIMGGWAMEDGCLAEMATGEGKTVTACLAAAVQAWMGYGVHVVTVNDYLARRDADLNGAVYRRLGLSVGVVQQESSQSARRSAYFCDVTYTTDQQLIFDFLRDRLHTPLQPRVTGLILDELTDTGMFGKQNSSWTHLVVLRGLYAAIIDEADSVLIDQATTPAIIGNEAGEDSASEYYRTAADIARDLTPGEHFTADYKQHRVDLTDEGEAYLEQIADRLPAFWSGPRRRAELVQQALTARELFHHEDHYVVRNGDIQIVDPQTGRVLEGRQWQLGLHQAIQAKEGLKITGARETMARMSYQRFFQQYRRLCGMTGTAWEVRHEIWSTYHMPVVRIPTHKPVIRRLAPDRAFITRDDKFRTVADRVERYHRQGRPVLLGTRSVEASEQMHEMLEARAVPHRVLNANRHEEEAAIVTAAGRRSAVTVATNMAGRGTDIHLGPGVFDLGGLVVIATERHDSRRIDRQLFGRSGRQGDPGLAEVYKSLDDLVIRQNGVQPLVKWLRRSSLPWLLGLHHLLWWHAQRAASRRQKLSRELIAQSDQWFDKAMYYEAR